MNIYLATWLEDNQAESLSKIGANNRLLSYYFIKGVDKGFMYTYSTFGIIRGRKENENK